MISYVLLNQIYFSRLEWVGPTSKIWSDNQCRNVGRWFLAAGIQKAYSIHECQEACQKTEDCTAINFKKSNDCVLRACTLPVPTPIESNHGYEGYYQVSGIKLRYFKHKHHGNFNNLIDTYAFSYARFFNRILRNSRQ